MATTPTPRHGQDRDESLVDSFIYSMWCSGVFFRYEKKKSVQCATSHFSSIHTYEHLLKEVYTKDETKWHWDWTELLNRLTLGTHCMRCTYFPKMAHVLVRTLTRHELWHLGCSQCGRLIDLGALLTSWTKKSYSFFKW